MGVLRRVSPDVGGSFVRPTVDATVGTIFPALVEFLSATAWDEQTPRQTGTLLLCAQDGRWRLWLNDREHARSAWLSGETIEEVVTAAEQGLTLDSLEWRGDREQRKPRR